MRRNTVTVLKYLIVGSVIVLGGPLVLKKLFGSDSPPDIYVDARNVMPKAPQDSKVQIESFYHLLLNNFVL